MIRYAVMTFMYDEWVASDNGSHEALIQIVAESGAQGIEAFCNTFMKNNELLKLYRCEIENAGLQMPVMDLIVNLACSDKMQRDKAYESIRRGMDICATLGSEIMHIAGCSLVEGVTPEDGRQWIAEGLSEFVDDAEKYGITLAFEDFDPSPTLICSVSDCLDIFRRTDDRVKFIFDTGNFEAVGEHAENNFRQLIDRTCHFHFKDFKADNSPMGYHGTYFGQGMVKNREIAQAIINADYSGWVALESYLQNGNGPRETISKELTVLKSMF